MRSSWRKLFQDSYSRISSPSFRSLFEVMKRRHPSLAAFLTPPGLVEHQHSKLATRQEKDVVLHDLISLYQQDPDLRDAAGVLLFLVMRPALAETYRKLNWLFDAEDDTTGEICQAFYDQLARVRIDNFASIAAILKLNVFHDVQENRLRLTRDRARIDALLVYAEAAANLPPSEEEEEEREVISVQVAWRALSVNGAYDPDDLELNLLRASLTLEFHFSSDDIELLILKNLCLRSWEEIGVRLGMKPETARKRHQRLVEKLKDNPDFQMRCPVFGLDPHFT